ncbi:hypothetical protein [Streptomyces werraensis]|uniref:hypothetical protein n=1 Tax=Streptomyces werraensis TaxID=68284 RepID=UPI00380921BE
MAADDDLVLSGLFESADDGVEFGQGAAVLLRDPGESGLLGLGDEFAGLLSLLAVCWRKSPVVMKNRQSRQGLAYSQSVCTGAPQ